MFNPVAVGPAWEFWFELLRFGLFFYFNFSGFSDIAVGTALLFGFKISPNFNNPYVKTNPQDFWNSWHMSLTKFCQRNVFVPLGGMRRNRQYPAILATIMVIALWHDLTHPARVLRALPWDRSRSVPSDRWRAASAAERFDRHSVLLKIADRSSCSSR